MSSIKMNEIINEINKLEQENKVCQEEIYNMDTSFIGEKMRNYLVSNNEIVHIKKLCQRYNVREFDFEDFDGLFSLKFILGNKYRKHDGEMRIMLMYDGIQELTVYTNYLVESGIINTNDEEFTLSRNCSNIDLMRFYSLLRFNIGNITNTLYREIRRSLKEEQLRMKSDIEFFKEFNQRYEIGESNECI